MRYDRLCCEVGDDFLVVLFVFGVWEDWCDVFCFVLYCECVECEVVVGV